MEYERSTRSFYWKPNEKLTPMTDAPTTPELANDATRGSHCGCSDLLHGISVDNLNKAFPKYPMTVTDKGWIYGVWYCPTAWMRTHFYGQYPLTFMKRVLALFPNSKEILHCPSGTVTGPGVTVDLIRDAQRQPQHIASAEDLPFPDNSFDLYLSDPPYSKVDSDKYGTPPFRGKVAMAEARRVLKPGGYYALLNLRYPSFRRKDWNFVALIAVVTGANRVVRLLSIFQKPPAMPGNE